MKKIIALKGRGGSGKTTTIHMLPSILKLNGYFPVSGKFRNYGDDFLDIYQKGPLKVGITSSGDSHDLLKQRLDQLINENCDVCICACRTYDRIHPGTIAAVSSYKVYPPKFLQKTYASSPALESSVNKKDAQRAFAAI